MEQREGPARNDFLTASHRSFLSASQAIGGSWVLILSRAINSSAGSNCVTAVTAPRINEITRRRQAN
jgi:hypothetical protein